MNTGLELIESITLLSILKGLFVILLAVYNVFAFLMMKQVAAMTRAVAMKDDFVVRVLSMAHFAFAVIVLILMLLIPL